MSNELIDEKALEAAQAEWVNGGWRQFNSSRVRRLIKAYEMAKQGIAEPKLPDMKLRLPEDKGYMVKL